MNHSMQLGWQGRFYEDFTVGERYAHALGRTISQTDNSWFTQLTQNTNPIHFDHHYAQQTEFQRPIVNSAFIIALVTGQSVSDISQNVMANLGWDEVRLPHPVFEGDTIYSYSEILTKRDSQKRPHVGIMEVKTVGYNQRKEIVIHYRRTMMIYKKGHAPNVVLPLAEEVSRKGSVEE